MAVYHRLFLCAGFLRPRFFLWGIGFLWTVSAYTQALYRPCRVSFISSNGVMDCTSGEIRAWSCHVWHGEGLPSNLAKPGARYKGGHWFIPWQELDCISGEGLEPYLNGDFGLKGPSGVMAVNKAGDTLYLYSDSPSDWIFDSEPSKGYPGLPLMVQFGRGISSLEDWIPTEHRLRLHHLYYREILIQANQPPVPEYHDRVNVLSVLGKSFKSGDKVSVSLQGAIYDGGSNTPFFTVQRKIAEGWEIAHDHCCIELDDAFSYWHRRDEILDLFYIAEVEDQPHLPVLKLEPGIYRLVMYDRYMRARVSEEFGVE